MITLLCRWLPHRRISPKLPAILQARPQVEQLEPRDLPSAMLPPGAPLVAGNGNAAPALTRPLTSANLPPAPDLARRMDFPASFLGTMGGDNAFVAPGDVQRIAAALDESFVAGLDVPAAVPPLTVTELVPVAGSSLDSVSILLPQSVRRGTDEPELSAAASHGRPDERLPFAEAIPPQRQDSSAAAGPAEKKEDGGATQDDPMSETTDAALDDN